MGVLTPGGKHQAFGPHKNRLLNKKVGTKTAIAYNATNPVDPIIGQYKQSVILTQLNHYQGKLSTTANSLGITTSTLQRYIQKSKVLQERLISFNEIELDNAENKLQKQIEKENLSAIQFYLKCKGKDRGWTEKTEMSIEMTKPITFKYTVIKPNEDKKKKK